MRVMLILRGAQGSGKSTFVQSNGLTDFTVSQDNIRIALYGYEREGSRKSITQRHNKEIYKLFIDTVKKRMENEEFLVIDNVNADIGDLKKLCKHYKYRMYVKDFTDYENKEDYKELLYKRNFNRGVKEVPNEVIDKTLDKLYSSKDTINEKVLIDNVSEIFYREQDFNIYDKVFVCGDIHGNYRVLKKVVDRVKDNDALVLLGDYLDRGFENDLVVELLSQIADKPNVYLLTGNHEKWIKAHISGEEIRSKTYRVMTAPQVERLDDWKNKLKKITQKLLQCLYFQFGDVTPYSGHYFLSHAGVTYWDERVINYNKRELVDGRMHPDEKASIYNELTWEPAFPVPNQIFGHISFSDGSVKKGSIYNLNSRLEFGGNLPLLIMEKGVEPRVEFLEDDYDYSKKEIDSKYIYLLGSSRDIEIKDNKNGIESYNFSEDTFRNRRWTELNVLARGLFVDKESKNVVARGYNKFFNYGELSDALEDVSALSRDERFELELEEWIKINRDKIKFPVKCYEKENGFLGLISIYNDKLLYCSKSLSIFEDEECDNKTFPKYLKAIAEPYKELIKKELNSLNSNGQTYTMVFEVIDPINDLHLVRYKSPKLVLLDIVENYMGSFNNLPYDQISDIASRIGIPVKKELYTVENFDEMQDVVSYVAKNFQNKEGLVCVDQNDFMFKVKSEDYLNKKSKRYMLDGYIRSFLRDKRKEENIIPKEDVADFKTYIMSFPLEELKEFKPLDFIEQFQEEFPELD